MDILYGTTVIYDGKFYAVVNEAYGELEIENETETVFCLPEEVLLLTCPHCGGLLRSLGAFHDAPFPYHLQEGQTPSEFFSGELFECANSECQNHKDRFFIDFGTPGILNYGIPDGVEEVCDA